MENAIARKLDPPVINPVEIESVLLNRLASVGQKPYAEHKLNETRFAFIIEEISQRKKTTQLGVVSN